jgi:hypothetical protein
MLGTGTGADAVTDYDHILIHEKRKYSISLKPPSTVAAAGTYAIGFHTPAKGTRKELLHMRIPSPFSSANLGQLQLFEGRGWTGGTITAYPVNNFRHREYVADPTNTTDTSNQLDLSGVKFVYGGTAIAAAVGTPMLAATAGGNFANQPAGDSVEVVSNSAADVGIIATIYGTITGATTTITTETVTLNGTTAVATTATTWQNILGVELSRAAAGTITFREGSGDLAITTITAGNLSAGVTTTLTSKNAKGGVPLHDASAASTAPVGLIGDDGRGTAITSVAALNGTTEEAHGTIAFVNVTKVLVGAVASSVNVTIAAPFPIIYDSQMGTAGAGATGLGGSGPTASEERVLEFDTDYLFVWTNIGATTATQFYGTFSFYTEGYNK